MTIVMIAATVACALACGALVLAELADDAARQRLAKPIASFAFVTVAVAAAIARPSLLSACIVVGQVLGMLGDLALLRSRDTARPDHKLWFAYGVAVFLAGHVAYIVGFATILSPLRWLRLASWPVLGPMYVAFTLARDLRARVDGPLRKLVPVYAAVITAMVIGAVAILAHGAFEGRLVLWIGAILFFVSDVFVARDLMEDTVWNRVWGLPLYYAGQLLIGWALVAGS